MNVPPRIEPWTEQAMQDPSGRWDGVGHRESGLPAQVDLQARLPRKWIPERLQHRSANQGQVSKHVGKFQH